MSQVKNDAGKTALKFAIIGGSAIAAGAGSKAAERLIPEWHGPIAMVIGLAGDLFIENENIRAATEGIGVWGTIQTGKEFIPAGGLKDTLGLGAVDNLPKRQKEIAVDSSVNWDNFINEAVTTEFEEVVEEEVVEEMSQEDMEAAIAEAEEITAEMELMTAFSTM